MSYRPISDVPPIIPIPSATTPTIAQPSALTALLLRAKLTDDGHCYLYAVAGLVPATLWTRKVERGEWTPMGYGANLVCGIFLVVITMSKRSENSFPPTTNGLH